MGECPDAAPHFVLRHRGSQVLTKCFLSPCLRRRGSTTLPPPYRFLLLYPDHLRLRPQDLPRGRRHAAHLPSLSQRSSGHRQVAPHLLHLLDPPDPHEGQAHLRLRDLPVADGAGRQLRATSRRSRAGGIWRWDATLRRWRLPTKVKQRSLLIDVEQKAIGKRKNILTQAQVGHPILRPHALRGHLRMLAPSARRG